MSINQTYTNQHKKTLNTKKIEYLNEDIDKVTSNILAIPSNIKSYNDILEVYDDTVKSGMKMQDTKEGYTQKRDNVINSKTTLENKKQSLIDFKNRLIEENKKL